MIYQSLSMMDDPKNLLALSIIDNLVNSKVVNKEWSIESP